MDTTFPGNIFILDLKYGDVTGDGVPDTVYLIGRKPDGLTGLFADDITLVVEDGRGHSIQAIKPPNNAGYDARLFLGDFNGDTVNDIKISIDAGGSGGYGYYTIYSFRSFVFRELFNSDTFNAAHQYKVDYTDCYKASVGNVPQNKLFTLDIGTKGRDYLSQYYGDGGKLTTPVQGDVLPLGVLLSVVINEDADTYALLAYQRVIGTSNADTLGYMESLLTWDGNSFVTMYTVASVPGTSLISIYPPF